MSKERTEPIQAKGVSFRVVREPGEFDPQSKGPVHEEADESCQLDLDDKNQQDTHLHYLYTDEATVYDGIADVEHQAVKHSVGEDRRILTASRASGRCSNAAIMARITR